MKEKDILAFLDLSFSPLNERRKEILTEMITFQEANTELTNKDIFVYCLEKIAKNTIEALFICFFVGKTLERQLIEKQLKKN